MNKQLKQNAISPKTFVLMAFTLVIFLVISTNQIGLANPWPPYPPQYPDTQQGGEIVLTNNMNRTVCELYITPHNNVWDPQRDKIDLGYDNQMFPGESIIERLPHSSGYKYEVRAYACNTLLIVNTSRRFHRGHTYDLDVENWGYVTNNSSTDICNLIVMPQTVRQTNDQTNTLMLASHNTENHIRPTGNGGGWSVYLGTDLRLTPGERVSLHYALDPYSPHRVEVWSCDGYLMLEKRYVYILSGDEFSLKWGSFSPLPPQSPTPVNQPPPNPSSNPCPPSGKWPTDCVPA